MGMLDRWYASMFGPTPGYTNHGAQGPMPEDGTDPAMAGMLTPQQMRSMMIGRTLTGAGIGLLSQGPSSTPISPWQAIGQGLAGAAQGAQEGRQDALQMGMFGQRQKLLQDQAAREEKKAQRETDKDAAEQAAAEQLASQPPPGVDPLTWRSTVMANKQAAASEMLKQQFATPEAPKTREFHQGGQIVTQEWNPSTKTWDPVGSGPAWKPGADTIVQAPKSIDERDDLTLRTADPASTAYAQAYYRQYMTPKMIQTEQGMAPLMPQVPPGIRPPTNMPAKVASPGGLGSPVPGTAPGMTPAMKTEMTKKSAQLDNVEASLKQYRAALKEGGTSTLGAVGIPTAANAKVGSAYTALLIEMKNLFELGALSGPDYGLMTKSVIDPNSANGVALGPEGLASQLEMIDQKLASARETVKRQYGSGAGREQQQSGAANPTTQQEFDALPSGSTYHDPDDPPGVLRVKP